MLYLKLWFSLPNLKNSKFVKFKRNTSFIGHSIFLSSACCSKKLYVQLFSWESIRWCGIIFEIDYFNDLFHLNLSTLCKQQFRTLYNNNRKIGQNIALGITLIKIMDIHSTATSFCYEDENYGKQISVSIIMIHKLISSIYIDNTNCSA